MDWDILSKEMKVVVKVRELNKKGENAYLNRLERQLKGEVSRAKIKSSLEDLFDRGILAAKWEKNLNGDNIKSYSVTGENQPVVDAIIKRLKR
jgi:competence protein ComGC